ncbi:MAG: hypothetical protein ACRDAM_13490, partial [Casimicrobium sp.]
MAEVSNEKRRKFFFDELANCGCFSHPFNQQKVMSDMSRILTAQTPVGEELKFQSLSGREEL